MAWTKTKTTIVASVAILLTTGTTLVMVMMHRNERPMSSIFEVRLVMTKASTDAEIMTFTDVLLSGRTNMETLNVQRNVLLDQSAIQSASVTTNFHIGEPDEIMVDLKLTPPAAKQFAKITRDNVGRRLAIIVGGKIIEAPRIAGEIPSGEAQIGGNFTTEEAKRLAALINNPNSK